MENFPGFKTFVPQSLEWCNQTMNFSEACRWFGKDNVSVDLKIFPIGLFQTK